MDLDPPPRALAATLDHPLAYIFGPHVDGTKKFDREKKGPGFD